VKQPIDLEIEAPATHFLKHVSKALDDIHGEYRKLKKDLLSDYSISFSLFP
jgi:hypothetical protein